MLRSYLFRLVTWAITFLAVGGDAHAAAFMDGDAIGALLNKDGTSAQRTYTGTFDITTPDNSGTVTIGAPYANSPVLYTDVTGYQPSQHIITSATAYFYIRDDASDSDTEEVRISFVRSPSDNGSGGDFDFARGQIANRSFTVFGGGLNSTVTAALQDGIIQYKLEADRGDFVLDYARLDVVASANPAFNTTAVPEPGEMAAWVGSTLIAIAALRALHRVMTNPAGLPTPREGPDSLPPGDAAKPAASMRRVRYAADENPSPRTEAVVRDRRMEGAMPMQCL